MIWCSLILALLALGLGQDVCGAGAHSSGSGLIGCICSYCHTSTQNDLVLVLTHTKPEALMNMNQSREERIEHRKLVEQLKLIRTQNPEKRCYIWNKAVHTEEY